MKRFLLPLLFLLACAIVAGYIYSNQMALEPVVPEESAEVLEGPPEPPDLPLEALAPEGAYANCVDREVGDVCTYIVNEIEYEGVCQDIYGTLVCGPTFPDGTF